MWEGEGARNPNCRPAPDKCAMQVRRVPELLAAKDWGLCSCHPGSQYTGSPDYDSRFGAEQGGLGPSTSVTQKEGWDVPARGGRLRSLTQRSRPRAVHSKQRHLALRPLVRAAAAAARARAAAPSSQLGQRSHALRQGDGRVDVAAAAAASPELEHQILDQHLRQAAPQQQARQRLGHWWRRGAFSARGMRQQLAASRRLPPPPAALPTTGTGREPALPQPRAWHTFMHSGQAIITK